MSPPSLNSLMKPTKPVIARGDAVPERGRLPAEREVLRVLWLGTVHGEHLVRSEIHRRMRKESQPTLGRVGQILGDLAAAGYLQSVRQRAQGNRKAAFYQLSEQGVELCRRLGFERLVKSLFEVSKEEMKRLLTRGRLSQTPETPGRVAAFYAYRGEVGRTTTIAHVARGLAESYAESQRVLVIDLNLETPELDSLFDPQGRNCSRGLGGLAVDFQHKPLRRRALWLRGALNDEEYLYRPFEKLPNLFYLQSGLGLGQDVLKPSERAEARSLLSAEVGLPGTDTKPQDFLKELRAVLTRRFTRTLIDSQSGRCVSSWVATQALADELVLSVRARDTSTVTVQGLRMVLASFLKRREDRGDAAAGVIFLFPVAEPSTPESFRRWIDRYLVAESDGPAQPPSYPVELIAWDPRIAKHPDSWSLRHPYAPLIARLSGRDGAGAVLPSPGLKLLLDVLDPEISSNRRSIAAGALTNVSLKELSRLLDWYVREPTLHKQTDAMGEELVAGIAEGQSQRLQSMFLRPEKELEA